VPGDFKIGDEAGAIKYFPLRVGDAHLGRTHQAPKRPWMIAKASFPVRSCRGGIRTGLF
jgi:hypothetical protein